MISRYVHIYIILVNSNGSYIEQLYGGMKATVGEANIRRKTETLFWLCDKYGHLAINLR